jgi:hypothetical protein
MNTMKTAQKNKVVFIRNLDGELYQQARHAAMDEKISVGLWISLAIKLRLNQNQRKSKFGLAMERSELLNMPYPVAMEDAIPPKAKQK